MEIKRFDPNADLGKLEAYLRDEYLHHGKVRSWLPQRLHDILYRMGAQEECNGSQRSADYIFLWEEDEKIVACILPDGENIYISIRDGYEALLCSIVVFSEEHCLPLFRKPDDGSVKFWIAINDRSEYMREFLARSGYTEYPEKEYCSCTCPMDTNAAVALPQGFQLLYGDTYAYEEKKWSALRLGFHPEHEAPDYSADMRPYHARKSSSMYPDSFECLVVEEGTQDKNEVCSYCFVYVDKASETALIEPVSTRQAYRRRGFATALMHGALLRCRQMGIKKCYVNSFGSRKDFYTRAGFPVESTVSFWHKVIRPEDR